MRHILSLLALLLMFGTTTFAGDENKSVREHAPFSEIYISVNSTVYITQGEEQSIEIVSERPDIGSVLSSVKKRRLIIKEKSVSKLLKSANDTDSDKPVKIYIQTPDITAISLSGRGMIINNSPINSRILDINLSGAGIMKLNNITTEVMTVLLSGAGELKLEGNSENTASTLKLNQSGSGKFIGDNFICKTADVKIAGSGRANINATESIEAFISGSAVVTQKGTGEVSSTILGKGKIEKE